MQQNGGLGTKRVVLDDYSLYLVGQARRFVHKYIKYMPCLV